MSLPQHFAPPAEVTYEAPPEDEPSAEAVYVDGTNVVVGHVGDSRTYHLHEGRLIQLTRDQTLVNRLVELGTLSPEEAEAVRIALAGPPQA